MVVIGFLVFLNFKATLSVISSDLPSKEGHARFTTSPLKIVCDLQVQR